MGPRSGLDILVKKQIPLCRETNPGLPTCYVVITLTVIFRSFETDLETPRCPCVRNEFHGITWALRLYVNLHLNELQRLNCFACLQLTCFFKNILSAQVLCKYKRIIYHIHVFSMILKYAKINCSSFFM
jgi:hypothetical protein